MENKICILGIDPGISHLGYGFIQFNGVSYIHQFSGVIATSSKDNYSQRLNKLFSHLKANIDKYRPSILAIERIYLSHNTPQIMNAIVPLAYARGIVLLLGGVFNLQVEEYSATSIKKSISGVAQANKDQIKYLVQFLLKLDKIEQSHEADALAAAICSAHHNNRVNKYR